MEESGAGATDLPTRVNTMIRSYVMQRSDAKSRVKWDEFRHKRVKDEAGRERIDAPEEYRDARAKVCEEAFLAMRARRSREDFVEYFVGTICAVPQALPPRDYRMLAARLVTSEVGWEEVRSLAMLTLSSMARV